MQLLSETGKSLLLLLYSEAWSPSVTTAMDRLSMWTNYYFFNYGEYLTIIRQKRNDYWVIFTETAGTISGSEQSFNSSTRGYD